MEKITVLYEEHPGLDGLSFVPMKMIVKFGRGNLCWNDPSVYYSVSSPFEQHRADEYEDEILGMTIIQSDLIKNFERPDQFGIYLPFVVERIEQSSRSFNFDYYDIEQFIIQLDDLEEVLLMNIRRLYEWRI